jgi:hypothetical protein
MLPEDGVVLLSVKTVGPELVARTVLFPEAMLTV